MLLSLLAQTYTYTTTNTSSAGSGFSLVSTLFWLAIFAISVVAQWKIFTKAGVEGWKSIIPVYNTYCLIKICGRPGWWLLLFFIPFVNIVIFAILSIDLAKVFGKSAAFGIVALFLFSIIGYLILAFGDAKYQGGKPVETTPQAPQPPQPAAAA